MINYGLALAGGGTRGAAHVGVLTALEEAGLLPNRIAGTSAGSIAAGLYAAGMPIKEMREMVKWFDRHGKKMMDVDIPGLLFLLPELLFKKKTKLGGLMKGERLKQLLCDLTNGLEIQGNCRGVLIPTVDLYSGDTIVFTNLINEEKLPLLASQQENVKWEKTGRICDIMMASSAVPGVFYPQKIKDYMLVDGGVTDNLPVNLLAATGEDTILAVDVGADYQKPYMDSVIETIFHSFTIMGRGLKNCRSMGEVMLLKPELNKKAGLLTFECMERCMEEGYKYTVRILPQIRKAIKTGMIQKKVC